jgi:hypothetical protein
VPGALLMLEFLTAWLEAIQVQQMVFSFLNRWFMT